MGATLILCTSNLTVETILVPSREMNDQLPTGERILYSEWRRANLPAASNPFEEDPALSHLPSLPLLMNVERPIILADGQENNLSQPLIEAENNLDPQSMVTTSSEPLITPLIWDALAPRDEESDTINFNEEPEAIVFFKRTRMRK